jgi:hypothetical protein
MAWVRLDDDFHQHPKILNAWRHDPASIGLATLALSWSGRYLTDGQIPRSFVDQWFEAPFDRNRAIQALEAAGVWVPNDDGWQIHDYLAYQDSREQILAKRQAESARKQRGRDAQSARNPPGIRRKSDGPTPTPT